MTFDPFGDFETKGYLRNDARAKDRDIVRRMEHSAFTTALDGAFADLTKRKTLTYEDVLATHKALFDAVYPWAGGDRLKHAPDLAISKGEVRFADPPQDPDVMVANSGTVMGYLAYGHPFLDGNGRTIMVVHCILAHRAGISIDWASTNKTEYLAALSKELKDPDKGHLDAYLKPFVGKALKESALPSNIAGAPGLDGEGEDRVLGKTDDAKLKAEYEAEKLKRKDALS